MRLRILLAPGFVAVLVAAACHAGPHAPARVPDRVGRPRAGEQPSITEPLTVSFPRISPADEPLDRAMKIGRFMEGRWPRIHLRPDANAMGTIAAFQIAIDYERYRGNGPAWESSVHRLSGDLRQASVELLQLAVQVFPRLRFATVWEDERLMFFWSKRQIQDMGPAWMYREFESFESLTRLAKFQPPLLVYARQHERHIDQPVIS